MRSSSGMLPEVGAFGHLLAAELRLAARLCRRVGHALSTAYFGLLDGWRMMAAYETLARLSDGELAKRGLRREDIPQAALAALHRPGNRRRVRR